MVIITINGKANGREFQNMAQTLAFAYQNGGYCGTERRELVRSATKTKGEPAADQKPGNVNGGFPPISPDFNV